MYNIKTNSGRKENYKYNKPSNNKKRQNGSHYQHNKYNKYKSRYNNNDAFGQNLYEYDSNTFYKKDSKKIKKIKKKDLIEVDEAYLPNPPNPEDPEFQENSSSHENSTYDYQNFEKTMEKSDKINCNMSYNNFDDDKSLTNEQDLNSSENNTIIFPNRNSLGRTNSQIFSDDKENVDNNIIINSPNFSNLSKTKSTSKDLNNIISSINLSSEDIKEAFYVPKRRNTIIGPSNINNSNYSNENQFNEIIANQNNPIQKAQQLNMLLNNNNNCILYNQNLNLTRPKSQNIEQIQPFSVYDSHNSNSFNHKNSFDSYRSSVKSSSIIDNEKEKENTDILAIHVKISQKETLVFKIRRYDDMFKTVKIFCEINKLDIKLIRPLIIYIIKALNCIYGIYNLKLKNDEIQYLKDIKNKFFPEPELKGEYTNDKYKANHEMSDGYFNMNYPDNINY